MQYSELTNEEDLRIARNLFSGMYMAGLCVAWAVATKRKLRYPELIGIWRGNELMHAGTRNYKEGIYFDVRGFQGLLDFTSGWGGTELRPNTEKELLAADPKITEELIRKAEYHLELLYPEHCVNKAESFRRIRTRKFVEDLERLSARHGVYLRSNMPSGWDVVLEESHGDELGYEVRLSTTGSMHLNRRLPG